MRRTEPTSPAPPTSRRRLVVIASLSATLFPLLFALCTDQVWEDFFITLRHAVNLVEGRGLTYQAGERIQGFSTPLGAMLASGATAVAGASQVTEALWYLRGLALAAFAAAVFFVLRSLPNSAHRAGLGPLCFAAGLLALESKTTAFTVNGMETAFFLAFLAGAAWSLGGGGGRVGLRTGLFWGGLLWTRPDGAVFIALTALAALAFPPRRRRIVLPQLFAAATVAAIIYLPWILFASFYYGTPVPQTVIAKSAFTGGFGVADLVTKLGQLPQMASWIALPPYAQHDPTWSWLFYPALIYGAVGTLYWLWPHGAPVARRASFTAFAGLVYLAMVNAFYPWSFPPLFLLTVPAWSRALAWLTERGPKGQPALRRAAYAGAALVLAIFAFMWIDYASVARAAMAENEWANRRRIGLWLRSNARPTDRVLLECPGYIGFFSQLKMLDFPGLVSPEVTDFHRRHGGEMAQAGLALQPEWLVLRPHEYQRFLEAGGEAFRHRYPVVRVFDRRRMLLERVPRHPAALFDSLFLVLRRKD